ncbi:Protein NLRC3 [Pelomyxa schiedti]|nr:Protein NLRC3 [Pelomyxa schiedti]
MNEAYEKLCTVVRNDFRGGRSSITSLLCDVLPEMDKEVRDSIFHDHLREILLQANSVLHSSSIEELLISHFPVSPTPGEGSNSLEASVLGYKKWDELPATVPLDLSFLNGVPSQLRCIALKSAIFKAAIPYMCVFLTEFSDKKKREGFLRTLWSQMENFVSELVSTFSKLKETERRSYYSLWAVIQQLLLLFHVYCSATDLSDPNLQHGSSSETQPFRQKMSAVLRGVRSLHSAQSGDITEERVSSILSDAFLACTSLVTPVEECLFTSLFELIKKDYSDFLSNPTPVSQKRFSNLHNMSVMKLLGAVNQLLGEPPCDVEVILIGPSSWLTCLPNSSLHFALLVSKDVDSSPHTQRYVTYLDGLTRLAVSGLLQIACLVPHTSVGFRNLTSVSAEAVSQAVTGITNSFVIPSESDPRTAHSGVPERLLHTKVISVLHRDLTCSCYLSCYMWLHMLPIYSSDGLHGSGKHGVMVKQYSGCLEHFLDSTVPKDQTEWTKFIKMYGLPNVPSPSPLLFRHIIPLYSWYSIHQSNTPSTLSSIRTALDIKILSKPLDYLATSLKVYFNLHHVHHPVDVLMEATAHRKELCIKDPGGLFPWQLLEKCAESLHTLLRIRLWWQSHTIIPEDKMEISMLPAQMGVDLLSVWDLVDLLRYTPVEQHFRCLISSLCVSQLQGFVSILKAKRKVFPQGNYFDFKCNLKDFTCLYTSYKLFAHSFLDCDNVELSLEALRKWLKSLQLMGMEGAGMEYFAQISTKQRDEANRIVVTLEAIIDSTMQHISQTKVIVMDQEKQSNLLSFYLLYQFLKHKGPPDEEMLVILYTIAPSKVDFWNYCKRFCPVNYMHRVQVVLEQLPVRNGFCPSVAEARRNFEQGLSKQLLRPVTSSEQCEINPPNHDIYRLGFAGFTLKAEGDVLPAIVTQLHDPSHSFEGSKRVITPAGDYLLFKFFPHLPAYEMAISKLHELLIGGRTTAKSVIGKLTVTSGTTTQIYPVLITQDISGASLDLILSRPRARLPSVQYSKHVLVEFITQPECAGATTFVKCDDGLLVSLENNRVFYKCDSLDSGNGANPVSAKQGVGLSILFCHDQMREKFNPLALNEFRRLDPTLVLDNWISSLQSCQLNLTELISDPEAQSWASGSPLPNSTDPSKSCCIMSVHIPPEAITRVFDTITEIQDILKQAPDISPLQLLGLLSPINVANFVETLHTIMAGNPKARFSKLMQKLSSSSLLPQSPLDSAQPSSACIKQNPNPSNLSLTCCRTRLDELVRQSQYALLVKRLFEMNGNTSGLSILPAHLQLKVLNSLDMSLHTLPPTVEREIYALLTSPLVNTLCTKLVLRSHPTEQSKFDSLLVDKHYVQSLRLVRLPMPSCCLSTTVLATLRTIQFESCDKLNSITLSASNLPALTSFAVTNCTNLITISVGLPASITFRTLHIHNCPRLAIGFSLKNAPDNFVVSSADSITHLSLGLLGFYGDDNNKEYPPLIHNISQLSISKCPIGIKAISLHEVFKQSASLSSLKIADNAIGDEGVRSFLEPLILNKQLGYLDISSNNIGVEGSRCIAILLKSNKTLLSLILRGNACGLDGIKAITEALKWNFTLTALDLSKNGIGNDSMKPIAELLKVNSTLMALDLSGNTISNDGAKHLIEAMKVNATLQNLELRGNMISSSLCDSLMVAVQHNYSNAEAIAAKFSIHRQCKGNCKDKFVSAMWVCIKQSNYTDLIALLNTRLHHCGHWIGENTIQPSKVSSLAYNASKSTSGMVSLHQSSLVDDSSTVLSVASSCNSANIAQLLILSGAIVVDNLQPLQSTDLVLSLLNVCKLHPPTCTQNTLLLLNLLARTWAQVGNWFAFKAVCVHSLLRDKGLDLSHLNLTSIPPDISSAIANFKSINLSGNNFDSLHSSLHSVGNLNFEGNPLRQIPEKFRCGGWSVLKKYLKYNGSPVKWNNRKLLVVGDQAVGKTTVLSCIMQRKKTYAESQFNTATDGIAVHNQFTMKKGSPLKWVAWDLGGQEILYTSHQFFLTSESVFLLVFNLDLVFKDLSSADAKAPLIQPLNSGSTPTCTPIAKAKYNDIELPSCRKIIYWLKQLQASQQNNTGKYPINVVLVGTHMDKIESQSNSVRSLIHVLQLAMATVQYPIHAAHAFALNMKSGEGIFVKRGATNEAGVSAKGVKLVIDQLEEICTQQELVVPNKWATLYSQITTNKKGSGLPLAVGVGSSPSTSGVPASPTIASEPITTWRGFCDMAADLGIGKEQKEETHMCADFLANAGAIIHFKTGAGPSPTHLQSPLHTSKPTKRLEDIVVLDPRWLSLVMQSVMTITGNERWMTAGFLDPSNVCHVFSNFPNDIHSALVELLQKFEIAHVLTTGKILIPALLPPLPKSSSKTRGWGTTFTGQCPFYLEARAAPPKSISQAGMNPVLGGAPPVAPGSILAQRARQPSQNYDLLTGREFTFPFIPIGFFSRLMVRILAIPGIVPINMWNSCMLVSMQQQRPAYQICTTSTVNLMDTTTLNTEEVCRAMLECSEETNSLLIQVCSTCSNDNSNLAGAFCRQFSTLIGAISVFIRTCYPSLLEKSKQNFPCPLCITSLHVDQCSSCSRRRPISNAQSHAIQGESNTVSHNLYSFSMEECVDAVKQTHGKLSHTAEIQQGTKVSTREHAVSISTIAPDVALGHLPILDYRDIEVESKPMAQGGFGSVTKGVWHGNTVAIKEPLSHGTGLTDVIYEASVMNSLSAHKNVVRFYGMCIQPSIRLVMEFVSPVVLRPPLQSLLGIPLLSRPDLGFLLAALVERANVNQPVTDVSGSRQSLYGAAMSSKHEFINSVLPMRLRRGIISDIARGLHHLHNRSPPLVHSDLHAGNIFVTSLDPDGSGPWAKIADFGLSEFLYSGIAVDRRPNIHIFAPEVLNGAKHDTRADVWSFGMLCRMIYDPFTTAFSSLLSDPTFARASLSGGGPPQLNEHAVRDALIKGTIVPQPPPLLRTDNVSNYWGGDNDTEPEDDKESKDDDSTCPPGSCPKWAYDLMTWCWKPAASRLSCAQIVHWMESDFKLPPLFIDLRVPFQEHSPFELAPLQPPSSSKTQITKVIWVGTHMWCGCLDGILSVTNTHLCNCNPIPCKCGESSWRAHEGQSITALLYVRNDSDPTERIMTGNELSNTSVVFSATAQGELSMWNATLPRNTSICPRHTRKKYGRIVARPTQPPAPLCKQQNTEQDGESTLPVGINCMAYVPGGKTKIWCGDTQGKVTIWECDFSGFTTPQFYLINNFPVSGNENSGSSQTSTSTATQPSGMVVSIMLLPMSPNSIPLKRYVLLCCMRGPIVVYDAHSYSPLQTLHHPSVDVSAQSFCCLTAIALCNHLKSHSEEKPSFTLFSPSPATSSLGFPSALPPLSLEAEFEERTHLNATEEPESTPSTPSVETPTLPPSSPSPAISSPPTLIHTQTPPTLTSTAVIDNIPCHVADSTIWAVTTCGTVVCWDVFFDSRCRAMFVPQSTFKTPPGVICTLTSSCTSSLQALLSTNSNSNSSPTALENTGNTADDSDSITPSAGNSPDSSSQVHHHIVVLGTFEGYMLIWDAQAHTLLSRTKAPKGNRITSVCVQSSQSAEADTCRGVCIIATSFKDPVVGLWCF